MKLARHEKIIELIQEYDIDTQEELAARLNEAGFKVTQATVSRRYGRSPQAFQAGIPEPNR